MFRFIILRMKSWFLGAANNLGDLTPVHRSRQGRGGADVQTRSNQNRCHGTGNMRSQSATASPAEPLLDKHETTGQPHRSC